MNAVPGEAMSFPRHIRDRVGAMRERARKACRIRVPVLFAGLNLDFYTNCRDICTSIHTYFPYSINPEPLNGAPTVYFMRCQASLVRESCIPFTTGMGKVAGTFVPFPDGRTDNEFFQVFTWGTFLFLRRGLEKPLLWLACDLDTPDTVVLVEAGLPAGQWAFRQCFLVLFHELMKSKGLYPLHAAAVSAGGRDLLLAASPGKGKTTMVLALVRRGFSFLSDDTVFFSLNEGSLSLVPFPEEVKVLPSSLLLFDELGFLAERALKGGSDKHSFRIEDVYGRTPSPAGTPAYIAFLERSPSGPASCEPLSHSGALKLLIPQLSLPLAQKPLAQSYFSMVEKLAMNVPSFRVFTGDTPAGGAALLERLMEER